MPVAASAAAASAAVSVCMRMSVCMAVTVAMPAAASCLLHLLHAFGNACILHCDRFREENVVLEVYVLPNVLIEAAKCRKKRPVRHTRVAGQRKVIRQLADLLEHLRRRIMIADHDGNRISR